MIGRGSRILPNKSTFTVIDLGNNAARFGLWDSYVNWHDIFRSPDFYLESLWNDRDFERNFTYKMPAELRAKFSKSENIDFNMKEEYALVSKEGLRPMTAVDRAIEHHSRICFENSSDFSEAMDLVKLLEQDIEGRVKKYSYCICASTDNYVKWLKDEYKRKLGLSLSKRFLAATVEE